MAEIKETNKPTGSGKNKSQITLDKILQSDIMVYIMFFVILVICIIIIGKAIGLGSPTF